jgi:Fe-S-cluster-containing dehydrogenase component
MSFERETMDNDREMTFDDLLKLVARDAAHAAMSPDMRAVLEPVPPPGAASAPRAAPGASAAAAGGSLPVLRSGGGCGSGGCGCGGSGAGHRGGEGIGAEAPAAAIAPPGGGTLLDKPLGRRGALAAMFGTAVAATAVASACSPLSASTDEARERKLLEWSEHFKGQFRLMTDAEKAETVQRLERLAKLRTGVDVSISTTEAQPGVMYGYAFNISKCKGYRNCVEACVNENNLDRKAATNYIRIFEMENGVVDLDHGDASYHHEVPAAGHFYLGTQCFQCANPPCVQVCPVGATWQEPDGITVIDYDWCIGCRYCMAACPYWARRFNWGEPQVPAEKVNPNQHYLGNRAKKKGVVEKCTYCIQRTREGRLPACAEACPTGARVFGNLLDPNSEIRWVLANKRVFRLKEDLKTEPRFWYFTD